MRTENQNARANPNRLGNGVRDKEHGELSLLPELQQFLLHLGARECIQGGEGLVHQENARLHSQRPRNRNPLLHAAGQCMRIAVGKLGQLHFSNIVHRAFFGLAPGGLAAGSQGKNNILLHCFPGKKLIELLKYEDTIGGGSLHHFAIQKDFAFHRANVAADGLKQRRLTATGGPENHESVRLQNFKTYAVSSSY